MNKFLIRTISGIIILLMVIFFTTSGGKMLLVSVLLLSSIASFEMNKALKRIGINYPLIGQLIIGFIINLLAYYHEFKYLLIFLAFVVIYAFISAAVGNKYSFNDMNGYLFSILYVNFLLSFILLLDKKEYIYVVYCCAWGTDTFAYIFGALFGKNKLIERLSPNKTVEGALGGILGSIVLVLLIVYLRGMEQPIIWAIFVAIGSVISQIGDICASAIKRKAGIKDYGNIIVGHGGILDRFDSVLFTLPIVYILSIIIGR